MTVDQLVIQQLGAQQLEILTLRVKLAESQAKVQEVSAQLAKQMTSKLTKPERTT